MIESQLNADAGRSVRLSKSKDGRPELYSTAEAASYLDLKPHTLEVWRSSRRHRIPFIRVGRLIRYRRSDLDEWLKSRAVDADVV